jgi:hypothetical protein
MTSHEQARVALILFNTLARSSRFWGNMEVSLLAGQLEEAGIGCDMFVLFMKPGEEEANRRTVEDFIGLAAGKRYDAVVMHASWLPWLPDALRTKTGAKIYSLDESNRLDLPGGLDRLDPHAAVIAALQGASTMREAEKLRTLRKDAASFNPRFHYTFLGTSEPVVQEMAFVSIHSCPYDRDIRANPRFGGLTFDPRTATRGCAYCVGARTYERLTEDEKRRRLTLQVRTLQRELPSLKEIAVPFPEDYLETLAWLIQHAGEAGIRPVTFSGQFRAGALVRGEASLARLIETAQDRGFRFILSVVGLESFNATDLLLFNRDSVDEVTEAVRAVSRLRRRFDPALFMPETVGSFILFHPWQTLAGLEESVEGMIRHQVEGRFPAININDLRIHPGVPLYRLAESEGLTRPPGERRVQDVPLGGYFAESPWRFRHADIARAHGLYSSLSAATPERIGLLQAVCSLVQANEGSLPDDTSVEADLKSLAGLVRDAALPLAGETAPLPVGETCNQRCETCLFLKGTFACDPDAAARVLASRDLAGKNIVTLAGREPTLLPWLGRLVSRIRVETGLAVRMLTNGRMLVYPRVAPALIAGGVTGFLVKLRAAAPHEHDRLSRVEGAFDQTIGGLRRLRELRRGGTPDFSVGAVLVAGKHGLDGLEAMVDLAVSEGAGELRFALPMGSLDLGRLGETAKHVDKAIRRARSKNVVAGTDPYLSFKWFL